MVGLSICHCAVRPEQRISKIRRGHNRYFKPPTSANSRLGKENLQDTRLTKLITAFIAGVLHNNVSPSVDATSEHNLKPWTRSTYFSCTLSCAVELRVTPPPPRFDPDGNHTTAQLTTWQAYTRTTRTAPFSKQEASHKKPTAIKLEVQPDLETPPDARCSLALLTHTIKN